MSDEKSGLYIFQMEGGGVSFDDWGMTNFIIIFDTLYPKIHFAIKIIYFPQLKE